jgi:hypothetical protein
MPKLAATVKNIVSTVHRAIWRFGIAFWLGVIFKAAATPSDRNFENLLFLLFPYLVFELIHTISEFVHPRPQELGASDPKSAALFFILVGLIGSLLWLLTDWHRLNEWPWLVLALLATWIAYVVRPRLP